MDQLLRAPFLRYNSYILTTHGAEAKEILNAKYALEQIPGIGMTKILAHKNAIPTKIGDFLDAMSKNGIAPITGAIRLDKDASGETIFRIDEATVYHKMKLVGFLPESEMKLLNLWKGGEKE
ncbi:hypothetical protein LJK88_31550 [Paenibacillus sp. P26]|nr:hypothetical protein LJK88_31550 [Paenibacillus sp. P26]UUZ94255.1 hypothetical protein LJK87_06525 [Paenibacillus sp. P25]